MVREYLLLIWGFKFESEWNNNKYLSRILYDKNGKVESNYLNGVK